jgi:acetyl esterase/lipase
VVRSLTVLTAALRGGGEPCERVRLAGVDTLVARPRRGVGPVVVYANAATPSGIDEPAVGRFLGGLAAAGFVAVAPELPCVRRGEVTPATVDALVSVVGASGRHVALIGASTGAGLAILAAADPRVADRVSAVTAIAPFASLRNILRLGTTGYYGEHSFDAAPLVGTAAARSLAASAPDDPAVPVLLANRDALQFDALYGDLAPTTRALVEELSPLTRIGSVQAPIELASSPVDTFFPVDESRALTRAANDVRLTVTPALVHVCPRVRPGLVRVAGVLERSLERAVAAERAPRRRPTLRLSPDVA